jgi:hypothetical protein
MRSETLVSGRISGGVTSVVSLIAAVLLPKCPLCVAVWLSGLGLGAASAFDLAPLIRPALLMVAVSTLVGWAIFERRRMLRRPACTTSCGCGVTPPRSG